MARVYKRVGMEDIFKNTQSTLEKKIVSVRNSLSHMTEPKGRGKKENDKNCEFFVNIVWFGCLGFMAYQPL